jgi:hypothetical protein
MGELGIRRFVQRQVRMQFLFVLWHTISDSYRFLAENQKSLQVYRRLKRGVPNFTRDFFKLSKESEQIEALAKNVRNLLWSFSQLAHIIDFLAEWYCYRCSRGRYLQPSGEGTILRRTWATWQAACPTDWSRSPQALCARTQPSCPLTAPVSS